MAPAGPDVQGECHEGRIPTSRVEMDLRTTPSSGRKCLPTFLSVARRPPSHSVCLRVEIRGGDVVGKRKTVGSNNRNLFYITNDRVVPPISVLIKFTCKNLLIFLTLT